MKFFKRNNKENSSNVNFNDELQMSEDNNFKDNPDLLKVEVLSKNFTIFSENSKKILLFKSDSHSSPTKFDSYKRTILDSFILKRKELYSLLYYDGTSKKYEMTDFVFKEIIPHAYFIILKTVEDNTYLFFDYRLMKNIKDYASYLFTFHTLLLISFEDHDELYHSSFYHSHTGFKQLLNSKKIDEIYCNKNNLLRIFSYITSNNKLSYISINGISIDNYYEDYEYNSLRLFSNLIDDLFFISKSDDDKEFVFNAFSPHEKSRLYDKIEPVNKLFLCYLGKRIEIIDTNFNCLYALDIDDKNAKLKYDSENDTYLLSYDNDTYIVIKFYANNEFFTVYNCYDDTTTLYKTDLSFSKDGFIDFLRSYTYFNVCEFTDCFLLTSNNNSIYFTISKDIPLEILNTMVSRGLPSNFLNSISFFDNTSKKLVELDDKYISIIKKYNIEHIASIKNENEKLVIKSYLGKSSELSITSDCILLTLADDTKIDITDIDINTSLSEYLLGLNLEDKFTEALIRYSFE